MKDIEQIVSDKGTFRTEIKEYMLTNSDLGNDYIMLGIIGAQSSGKSTLLNHLFHTNFKVMDSHERRKQTTKGIWINASKEHKLVVLDIEGADSRERWEDKEKFEKSTALFGLVISNILIVNIWVQEIGRFSACNYDILKIIFELNLRYFKKESPKKIMFVIRDFSKQENLEFISNTLKNDIEKLWQEINKPEQLKNIKYQDVFQVLIFPMNNYIYEKDKFLEDVVDLRR